MRERPSRYPKFVEWSDDDKASTVLSARRWPKREDGNKTPALRLFEKAMRVGPEAEAGREQ